MSYMYSLMIVVWRGLKFFSGLVFFNFLPIEYSKSLIISYRFESYVVCIVMHWCLENVS